MEGSGIALDSLSAVSDMHQCRRHSKIVARWRVIVGLFSSENKWGAMMLRVELRCKPSPPIQMQWELIKTNVGVDTRQDQDWWISNGVLVCVLYSSSGGQTSKKYLSSAILRNTHWRASLALRGSGVCKTRLLVRFCCRVTSDASVRYSPVQI